MFMMSGLTGMTALFQVSIISENSSIKNFTYLNWSKLFLLSKLKYVLGSPFHPKIVDPRKVRVIGGWESFTDSEGRLELALHNTKKISLDVAEAGPGKVLH